MKTIVLKLLMVCVLSGISFTNLYAYTFTWTGASSTVWELSTNWNRTGSGGTSTYPGQSGTVDVVQIGTGAFTRQPVQSATASIASLTIGTTTATTLTINGTLTITGDITQNNNGNAGGITTNLAGSGSLTCTNFNLGDSTVPPAPVLGLGNATYNTILNFSSLNLTVSQNLVLTTTTKKANLLIVVTVVPSANVNNPVFNFNSGTVTVGNQIQTVDSNDANLAAYLLIFPGVSNSAQFLVNPPSSNTATLNLKGANALNLDGSAGYVDFNASSAGTSIINYNSLANQKVYTSTTPYSYTRQSPTGFDQAPSIYQNVSFAGAATKTADGGSLTVDKNFTLSAGTDTVDLSANSTITAIGADLSSASGTEIKQGSGAITIKGSITNNAGILALGSGGLTVTGNYNNTGTYTQTTGTTLFNGASAQGLQDGSLVGTVFHTVNFSGAGAKTLTSGKFYVNSTSVLTMIGSSALAANGNLTLNSDANGSATVAAKPSGASITGNVNVQRYLKAIRGYRLLSSPVNTGTGIYSINYLINSTYLTGTTGVAGGFDKTGNPTLYLFRENLAPLYTTFLNSNYRGINTISGSPNYLIDSDVGTYTIPTGNGYLFFFRGDRSIATLAAETNTTYMPTSAVITATGILNQDSIKVKNWYTPASAYLGYSTTAGNDAVRGFNLVGNPYASSIDWDTYSVNAGSAIYAPKVKKFIYMFDPGSKNYAVYAAGTPGKIGTNGATNIVASGQGFFVIDSCASCAKLVFTEAAKINTQVTGSNLLMDVPLNASVSTPYLRLLLYKDSVNTDETIVNFDDNSHAIYNTDEDAPYKDGQGKVSLASLSSDGVGLAINNIPLSDKKQYIGLNVNATSDGVYQLDLRSVKDIPSSYAIWLMDAYKKDSLDMRKNEFYSFNIYKNDTLSFGPKRFVLVIKPPLVDTPAVAIKKINKAMADQSLVIYPNPARNIINFSVPGKVLKGASISITNSLGLKIKKVKIGNAMQTNIGSLKPDTYVVLLVSIDGTVACGKFVKF